MGRPLTELTTRYGLAILCAAAAVAARWVLAPLWGDQFPYLTLLPAVLVSAWFGGLGPGLLCTGLGALGAAYLWLAPIGDLSIQGLGDQVSMVVFLLVGAGMSALAEVGHRRERRTGTIIESIGDALAVVDRDWRVRFANQESLRQARRPREEVLGRRIWEIFPALVGGRFEAEARAAFTDLQPHRFEFLYPPLGGWADVQMYPSPDGLTIHVQDIAAQKQAERLSSQLAAIVSSSDDAIVSKDLNGTIMSWNLAAERIFGYSAAEAVGRHITMIIPPDRLHEEDEVLGRIRRGQSVDHFETIRRRKDGSLLPISLTVSPVRNPSGEIIGASKIARDITDRRHADEQREELLAREQAARKEAEAASRAKDDFLTTLSHELRTPLNAVYGWAAMLKSGQLDPANTGSAVDAIMRNANAQVQLIDDLLDVARISSGKLRLEPQRVDLMPVVEAAADAIRPAALAKGVRIDVRIETDLARAVVVIGDANRLQQVVWNLLSNAVKFTPREGRVEVRLQWMDSHAQIVVADTGAGITADLLPFVFERFRQGDSSSTRAHTGLGLGLTLVKHLVELHGGAVTAQSAGPGLGSTFTVQLPVAPPVPGRAPERPHPARARFEPPGELTRLDGLRVLSVDDDRDALGLMATILGRAGARVESCASARAAFAVFQDRPPDVLISDIEMPDEDGYSLIKRIRALESDRGGRIPAIALTAYGRREDRLKAVSSGYSMHVPKPVDPAELTTIVASLTGRV
jgi:PAS domain S-box-containing protein